MGRRIAFAAVAVTIFFTTRQVSAACSHDIAERGLAEYEAMVAQREGMGMNILNKRQSPPTSEQQAQWGLTDPNAQCSPYYWAGSEAYQGQFPPIWQIATIVPGDTEAQNAFNTIINNPSFPNLAPKGTPQGDFTSVAYNSTDPDCWWTYSRCDSPKRTGIPADVNSCAEPSTWGLTYDDGPNCTHNALYNFLQEQQQTATMYFIGSNTINWPLQAQRALHDGHEIGIHTWSHRYCTALTNEQLFAELWYTRKAIKDVIGVTPTTWRAPYGDVDDRVRAMAHGLGLTTVLWDHDMFDWQIQNSGNPNGLPTASIEQNYNNMYAASQQGQFSTHGTIVLTHEINGATMDMAIEELPRIRGNFKHVVPVATCQNNTRPYNETSYSFPTFDQYLATNSSRMSNSTSGANTTSSSSPASGTSTLAQPTSMSAGSTRAGSAAGTRSTSQTSGIHAANNNKNGTSTGAAMTKVNLSTVSASGFVLAISVAVAVW